MKFELKEAEFKPVVLTLENEEELMIVTSLFGGLSNAVSKHILNNPKSGYDQYQIFQKLKRQCSHLGLNRVRKTVSIVCSNAGCSDED